MCHNYVYLVSMCIGTPVQCISVLAFGLVCRPVLCGDLLRSWPLQLGTAAQSWG